MSETTLPVLILAGSSLRGSELPSSAGDRRSLLGNKGVDVEVGGQPLIVRLLERLRAVGGLGSIWIAGPAERYSPLGLDVELIDTDGPLAVNLRRATAAVLERAPGQPIAVVTSDILPHPTEMRVVMEAYRQDAPVDVWFPVIRAPSDPALLSAFGWKPEYRVAPESGRDPVEVLPSHFAVLDPSALRLDFALQLLDAAYRTRNRPAEARRRSMAREMIWTLLTRDLKQLAAGHLPDVTWTLLRTGVRMARGLKRGITKAELEACVADIGILSEHRRQHPERGVRMPILDALSLAKDVDTAEEAQELHEAWEAGDA